MAWKLAPSLVSLRNEINAAYPGRSKVSDGSIGDISHSARTSDHNPDRGGWVRAIDVTQWDPGTPANPKDDVAERLAEFLRAGRDPRLKYAIWRGRMFSSYSTASRRAWEWGRYTGPNGHFHHCHVSVVATSGGLDPKSWGFGASPHKWTAITPGADDRARGGHDVAEAQIRLQVIAAHWKAPDVDPGVVDGRHGPRSCSAVSAFKKRIIGIQKATGQKTWPSTDPIIGPATIAMLRWWSGN